MTQSTSSHSPQYYFYIYLQYSEALNKVASVFCGLANTQEATQTCLEPQDMLITNYPITELPTSQPPMRFVYPILDEINETNEITENKYEQALNLMKTMSSSGNNSSQELSHQWTLVEIIAKTAGIILPDVKPFLKTDDLRKSIEDLGEALFSAQGMSIFQHWDDDHDCDTELQYQQRGHTY